MNKTILLLIILTTLLTSCEFFKPAQQENILEYNNYQFNKTGSFWMTTWHNSGIDYELKLRYNPQEAENVTISGTPEDLQGPIYLAIDFPEWSTAETESAELSFMALAASELSFNLKTALSLEIIPACTNNITGTLCTERPIINCQEGTSVIKLSNTNPTSITFNNTCVTIQGEGTELVRAVDNFLYTAYKIIQQ